MTSKLEDPQNKYNLRSFLQFENTLCECSSLASALQSIAN